MGGRVTSVRRCSTGLALGLTILTLVGCGGDGGMSTADAEAWLTTMSEKEGGGTVGSVNCIDGGEQWDCIVDFTPTGGDAVRVAGTLRCDDTNCLWRPG